MRTVPRRGNDLPATITSDAPASGLDPFSEEFLRDPYSAHEQLREAGPVVRLERYGIWGMARCEHVAAALGDHDTARRAAAIELAGEPVLKLNNTLRGFERLPVSVRAA